MTRLEQWHQLLAAISEAKKSGDISAREHAEWQLVRFLRGQEGEVPTDYKLAQSGDSE